MKRFASLLIVILLTWSSIATSESPAEVAEVEMPLLDYVSHIYRGPAAGRHYAPLAFVVGPDKKIAALVSGTADHRGSTVIPPSGPELISALKQSKTIGFNERDAKLRGEGFLRALDSARTKVSGWPTSGYTVVLIRNPNMMGSESGRILNPKDQEWEDSLRENLPKINSMAKLLVIRLKFPNQQPDGSTMMQESGCTGDRCKSAKQE